MMGKRQGEQAEKEAAQRSAAPVTPPAVPIAAFNLATIRVPPIVEA